MIVAMALVCFLAAVAPADDATLGRRLATGRIAAAVGFVAMVGGLAYGARLLARRAKEAEDSERLDEAFRELDQELAKRNDERWTER